MGRDRVRQRHACAGLANQRHSRRAKAAGKVTVLGGPSVSGAPEMYPDFDYLHVGEMGDATDALIALLDASVAPPPQQIPFETKERLPLADFPLPAYEKIPLRLPARFDPVFERLSVPVRVLRHPRALRPPAAAEIAGADHPRTRHDDRAAEPADGRLFRRRQFHRQSQGGARHASASRRMAEAPRLSPALCLRSDAQPRQAGRDSPN